MERRNQKSKNENLVMGTKQEKQANYYEIHTPY